MQLYKKSYSRISSLLYQIEFNWIKLSDKDITNNKYIYHFIDKYTYQAQQL